MLNEWILVIRQEMYKSGLESFEQEPNITKRPL